ncbi:hypothetical protein Tco_0913175 [Tanacetum coccineum]
MSPPATTSGHWKNFSGGLFRRRPKRLLVTHSRPPHHHLPIIIIIPPSPQPRPPSSTTPPLITTATRKGALVWLRTTTRVRLAVNPPPGLLFRWLTTTKWVRLVYWQQGEEVVGLAVRTAGGEKDVGFGLQQGVSGLVGCRISRGFAWLAVRATRKRLGAFGYGFIQKRVFGLANLPNGAFGFVYRNEGAFGLAVTHTDGCVWLLQQKKGVWLRVYAD